MSRSLSPILGALREAEAGSPSNTTAEVVLITPGPGNVSDGNYYDPSVIAAAVPVFQGARCFLDHPTASEERDRPERTVKELCGWFQNVRVGPDGALLASFVAGGAGAELARTTIEAALRYQKEFPEQTWAGYSINADGEGHAITTPQLLSEAPQYADRLNKREVWNKIDAFTRAMSVDLVTFAARGGKVLSMSEAESSLSSSSWRTRFTESQQEFTSLLSNRIACANGNPDALADVVFAVRSMRESDMSPEVVSDLRRQADDVEETHDPKVIADLLKALRAYLGEEMLEDGAKRSKADTKSMKKKKGEPAMADAKKESDGATEAGVTESAKESKEGAACEACGHKMEAGATEAAKEDDGIVDESAKESKEAFPFKKKGAKAKADAADDEPDEDDAKESDGETVQGMTLVEAEREVLRLRKGTKLAEADKLDLERLRIKERRDVKQRAAEKAIEEAGVEGLIAVERLMTFKESQWPTLIDMAQTQSGPVRHGGSGQIDMPHPAQRRVQESAVDAFNRAYDE